ncbi:MAG: flagellar basal-body MS-ring/collar protein FliF [Rhodocyclaceae bacterium]
MADLLKKMGTGARVGLLVGVLAIATFMIGGSIWLLRPDYEVLFSDLTPQDASVMTAELDKAKTPYRLENQGTAIAVPKEAVYKTRIALMGKDLPLHGTVGFELFNNSDFGATEFAQKVNYQRALQGEVTRTILSIAEIRSARLHLAIPEDTLFKKNASAAKASVFLSMKDGQRLTSAQVSGIQRLVAAAVPGIQRQDVTIVDEHGVALTRNVADASDAGDASPRLDLKRETETYLERKAQAVLDKALGAGQAMASVAVALDMDRVQVTTEDVVAPPMRNGEPATGVIVHERSTDRRGMEARGASTDGGGQREVDYQVGRRVEQIISAPGSVRRLQVAAVMRRSMSSEETERLRALLMAAVGGSPERGDSVVVQAMPATDDVAEASTASGAVAEVPQAAGGQHTPAMTQLAAGRSNLVLYVLVATILVCALCSALWSARRKRSSQLNEAERAALLGRIEHWLAQSETEARTVEAAGGRRELR